MHSKIGTDALSFVKTGEFGLEETLLFFLLGALRYKIDFKSLFDGLANLSTWNECHFILDFAWKDRFGVIDPEV